MRFAALIIKRHIDLSSHPMALPLQDPVPISCRIYLSPTMPLGRYHSQCKRELGALKTRGANWRKRRSLCCCGGTQMDGSLVDTQAGFKPFYITQVRENASAECQIRSCCCLIRFGLCVRHYMCLKFWFSSSVFDLLELCCFSLFTWPWKPSGLCEDLYD